MLLLSKSEHRLDLGRTAGGHVRVQDALAKAARQVADDLRKPPATKK